MKHFLVLVFLICSIGLRAQDPPNIVFIMLDDMGWSDLGCYGSEIPTPHIDALAYNGIRCTNFYNGAVCVPTRSMLLSGIYPQQNGFDSINANGFFSNAITVGEVLKASGYQTMISGKHHSGENLFSRGFDKVYGLLDGAMNYFNPGMQRQGEEVPAQKWIRKWVYNDLQFYTHDSLYQDFFPSNFYSTTVFTDTAIAFLEDIENQNDPFFLYLSYNAPHDPLQAPDSLIALFDGYYDNGYHPVRDARYQKQLQEGLFDQSVYPLSIAGDMPNWNNLSDSSKQVEALKMEVYAAMIKMVDIQIGRLIDYLEATGKRDNTLIFLTSDNGASAATNDFGDGQIGDLDRFSSQGVGWSLVSNTPFRKWKLTNYEGGINGPLIINWPAGITNPGRIVRNRIHMLDILPTLINLSGSEYTDTVNNEYVYPMQGYDISSILYNQSFKGRERPMYFKFNDNEAIIDENNIKAIHRSSWELYDLASDATETTNIASTQPLLLFELIGRFNKWFQGLQQNPPVALPDTVFAYRDANSLIDVFSNDYDSDGLLDHEETEIISEPADGIILYSGQEEQLVYQSFGSQGIERDSFSYIVFDDKAAFSHPVKVIVELCDVSDSCGNILLENETVPIFKGMFSLYPNPAEQDLVIEFKESFDAADFSLINQFGQLMDLPTFELINQQKILCHIANLQSGLYFVRYKKEVKKFIKW